MLYDDEFPLLEGNGLYASPTTGAGDCLFHSLSDQLYGHEEHHLELRTRVVEHLKANADYFKSFIDVAPVRRAPRRKAAAASKHEVLSHTENEIEKAFQERLDRMKKSGVFGDNLEIQAFAREFSVDVKIYQRDFSYVIRADNGPEQQNVPEGERTVVHIAYHRWEHYSSIRNRAGPHSGPPNVCPRPASPQTIAAGQEKASGSAFQPWMVTVVTASLPYEETEARAREVLEEHNFDVNATTLYLLDCWERDEGLKEDTPEPEDDAEIRGEQDHSRVLDPNDRRSPEPEIPNTPTDAPTPVSVDTSLCSVDTSITEVDDSDVEEDDNRSKRRKSPDGTPVVPKDNSLGKDEVPSKPAEEIPTPSAPIPDTIPQRPQRAIKKPKAAAKPPTQPMRRSPRIRAKVENAQASKETEKAQTQTQQQLDTPLSKKQQRKSKRKASARPSSHQHKDVGAYGGAVQTVTVGIRELYV